MCYSLRIHTETLEKRICNSLFWCPTGQFIILAGLRNMNGTLEFVDTSDMTIMTPSVEHFQCTDIEWDPTGRYVTSAVSFWGQKVCLSVCLLVSYVPFSLLASQRSHYQRICVRANFVKAFANTN